MRKVGASEPKNFHIVNKVLLKAQSVKKCHFFALVPGPMDLYRRLSAP